MSGHTPGPWEVRNTGRPGVWKRAGSSWVKIAAVEAPDTIPPLAHEKMGDNARLIAASPELYTACKVIWEAERTGKNLDEALGYVQQAITKAERP